MSADLRRLAEHGIDACEVLDGIGWPLVVLDASGLIVATNQLWRALPGELVDHGARYLDRHCAGGDIDLVLAEGIERVLAGRSSRFEIEYMTDEVLGRRWQILVATPLGGGAGAVVSLIDVTAQHDVRDILEVTAHRDTLTGLPNRRAIIEGLNAAITRGRRESIDTAVVFVDLNGFKSVNDALGHEVGDEVLTAVGRRLAATVRADDLLGRWGGDEFVIVVVDGGQEAAHALAKRLHRALDEPVAIRKRRTVRLGLAIGAAQVVPGETAEDVLGRADVAMFEAKRSGLQLVVDSGPRPEADR